MRFRAAGAGKGGRKRCLGRKRCRTPNWLFGRLPIAYSLFLVSDTFSSPRCGPSTESRLTTRTQCSLVVSIRQNYLRVSFRQRALGRLVVQMQSVDGCYGGHTRRRTPHWLFGQLPIAYSSSAVSDTFSSPAVGFSLLVGTSRTDVRLGVSSDASGRSNAILRSLRCRSASCPRLRTRPTRSGLTRDRIAD